MRMPFIATTAAAFLLLTPLTAQKQAADPPRTVDIPAGEFEMGSERGAGWEKPTHKVRTPKFAIGARPVTNAEFAAFKPGHASPGDTAPAAPVTGVSWEEAQHYCAWLSRSTGLDWQLPYEAWWERAARGHLKGSIYPWGDQPLADGAKTPPNGFGVEAVGFNLWEWTADWYSPNYFSVSPVVDPHGPEQGVYRVLRGGGYRNDPGTATVYNRGSARPNTASASITFRVARALEAAAPPPTVSSATPPHQAKPAAPKAQPQKPAPARAGDKDAPPKPPASRAPDPASPAPPAAVEPLASGSIAISEVAFETSGNSVVVTLTTASRAPYKTMKLGSPDRLVVDIPGGDLMNKRRGGELAVDRNGVQRVRYSQFQLKPPAVRVVIDLDAPIESAVEASPSQLRVKLGGN